MLIKHEPCIVEIKVSVALFFYQDENLKSIARFWKKLKYIEDMEMLRALQRKEFMKSSGPAL